MGVTEIDRTMVVNAVLRFAVVALLVAVWRLSRLRSMKGRVALTTDTC